MHEFICSMPEWEIMQGREASKPRELLEFDSTKKPREKTLQNDPIQKVNGSGLFIDKLKGVVG